MSRITEDLRSDWCPKLESLPDYIKVRNKNGTEDTCYQVSYQGIPAEFNAVAEKELNETEENKIKGLKKLREFVKKEKLPNLRDSELIMILRVSKYNVKKAETKLKKFLRARETIIAKLELLDMKKVERIIEDGGIGILPFRDRKGRAIVFTRPDVMNEDLYTMDDVLLTGVACAMLVLSYPMSTIAGVVYIGDGRFSTAASYLRLLKSYHQYMWTFLDLPVRIGKADIIHEHFITRWFFNIVRPFLSFKIVSRISFHGSDLNDLNELYHPDLLPEEFGGNTGPVDPSFYKSFALDYIKMLLQEGKSYKEAAKLET